MVGKKLRPKYTVTKIRTDATTAIWPTMLSTDPDDINSPFVLMPRKDPAAFIAMLIYAQHCEPVLSAEIITWLRNIAAAPPVLGTQGARNTLAERNRMISESL